MRRRWHDHDDEPAALEALPLFDWPQVPPAEAEPHVLPLEGTIAARYAAWRQTEDGERVFLAFVAEGLGEVARGATRLSAKACWERVRARLRVPINNSFTALVVRDAESACPTLKGLYEKRMRRAS